MSLNKIDAQKITFFGGDSNLMPIIDKIEN